MTEQRVIVIERSDSEARALEALLHFLDLEPLRVRDPAELRRFAPAAPDCFAVILGGGTVEALGAALIEQLRALPQPMPVIHLSNDGLPKIAESSGDLAWFQLEMPV